MDEITLFAEVRPAPPADEDDTLAAARTRLTAAAAPASRPIATGRWVRARRRPIAVATAALAVAAAVIATQTVSFRGGSLTTPPPADAATVLNRAADAAASTTGPTSRRGDYVRKDVHYLRPGERNPALAHECTALWDRVGAGMLYQDPGYDRCTARVPTRPPAVLAGSEYEPRQAFPAHPSSDPRVLLGQIYRGIDADWRAQWEALQRKLTKTPPGPTKRQSQKPSKRPPVQEQSQRQLMAFITLSHMLEDNVAAPARSVVFRTLALIPLLTVQPDATDALGRHGVAVAARSGKQEDAIILDRGTYQYLGYRAIADTAKPSTWPNFYVTALARIVVFPARSLPRHR